MSKQPGLLFLLPFLDALPSVCLFCSIPLCQFFVLFYYILSYYYPFETLKWEFLLPSETRLCRGMFFWSLNQACERMFCCEHVVFFGKLPGDLLPERTLERTRDTWKGYLYNQSTDRDAALALVRLARSSLCFADLAFFSHLLLLLLCREKPGEELLVVFCLLLTASADSC